MAGIAAVALLGLLFTPDKGSKTRKDISTKEEDFIAGLKESFDDLRESIVEDYEEAKENASDFAKKHGKPKS